MSLTHSGDAVVAAPPCAPAHEPSQQRASERPGPNAFAVRRGDPATGPRFAIRARAGSARSPRRSAVVRAAEVADVASASVDGHAAETAGPASIVQTTTRHAAQTGHAAQLRIGTVVCYSVAVVVEVIAFLGARLAGRTFRATALAISRTPTDPADHARILVHAFVAVVVPVVAGFASARVHVGVTVIAVVVANAKALARAAAHHRGFAEHAVAVAIGISAVARDRDPFVDFAVAVVVFAVANLGTARKDLGIVVVAIPDPRGKVGGHAASDGVAGALRTHAVIVVVVVEPAAATAEGHAVEADAFGIPPRAAIGIHRVAPGSEVHAPGRRGCSPRDLEGDVSTSCSTHGILHDTAALEPRPGVDDTQLPGARLEEETSSGAVAW